jgi:hypothetical protein
MDPIDSSRAVPSASQISSSSLPSSSQPQVGTSRAPSVPPQADDKADVSSPGFLKGPKRKRLAKVSLARVAPGALAHSWICRLAMPATKANAAAMERVRHSPFRDFANSISILAFSSTLQQLVRIGSLSY